MSHHQSKYVDRGDAGSNDFDVGDFTADATWRDLDLSSIVPDDAVSVLLKVVILTSAAAGQVTSWRKNGNTGTFTASTVRSQVLGVALDANVIVPVDSGQVIEYFAANVTWTLLRVNVLGWFLG